MVFHKLTDYCT